MRRQASWFWIRLVHREHGQAAVIFAFSIVAFLGLAGVSVEAGHGYYAYEKLVASTNAAALAGAQGMPNTTTASANVTAYSSAAGSKNALPMLQNVQVNTTFLCLNTVTSTLKTACETSTGGSGGYNALQVKQTAQVPSWFAGMFGINLFNISATATASMRGGTTSAWNIALILDATHSMSDPDSGAQCSGTQESCALLGMQALLGDLYPCALGQTCSSSGSTYVDDVSLYIFPPMTTATAPDDYCSGGSPSSVQHGYYVVPTLSAASTPYTYQITTYANNYKTTDTASGLYTSSNVVAASGYSGTSCTGVDPIGGAGTYYAQAIYKAQSDLAAQATANAGSLNAMIILSDGNATATVSTSSSGTYVYSSTTTGGSHPTTTYTYISSTSDLQPSSANSLNGIPANNPSSPTYPSAVGECGQAVLAAQAAANAGTRVFTIGYGSETSGCSSDATYSASVTTNGGSWAAGDSPCQALAAMASAQANFFSDDGDGCQATVPSNQSLTTLTAIFHQITANLTNPRLIPNGTT
jgi:Flp pilus assembly protein TadG